MSAAQQADQDQDTSFPRNRPSNEGAYNLAEGETPALLDPASYTAHRLHHATPEHLHITTRRVFVGPVPKGWLQTHRHSWYSRHLTGYYAHRDGSFVAEDNVSKKRRLTTLGTGERHDSWKSSDTTTPPPHASSFPQPTDIVDEPEEGPANPEGDANEGDDGSDGHVEDTTATASPQPVEPVGLTIPRRPTLPQANTDNSMDPKSGDSFMTALESPKSWGGRKGSSFPNDGNDNGDADNGNDGGEDSGKSDSRKASTEENTETAHARFGGGDGADELSPISGLARTSTNLARSESAKSADATDSLSSLLRRSRSSPKVTTSHQESSTSTATATPLPKNKKNPASSKPLKSALKKSSAVHALKEDENKPPTPGIWKKERSATGGLVRFKTHDNAVNVDQEMQRRLAHMSRRRSISLRDRRKIREGEIVKMEKMLVRVEFCTKELPQDYDENESLKVATRVLDKWREYVIVCRETGSKEAPLALKLYKTRVIPAVEKIKFAVGSTREIPLNRRITNINLYSSLDKTLVLWLPHKGGSIIFIMRPRSAALSVEWYTFLRKALGWNAPDNLVIQVPDLALSLRVSSIPEESNNDAKVEGQNKIVPKSQSLHDDGAAAHHFLSTSMQMLKSIDEWREVVDFWRQTERMGLAWRRYDRLEWIHGVNEQKMYGSMGMQKTHELELRPKLHYPTDVMKEDGCAFSEPPPVEGFLIRLTSVKGKSRRPIFYKRMYFCTHDNLLFFCKPARALPPTPPKLPRKQGSKVPDSEEIVDKIPLIFAVAPYPIVQGQIDWVKNGNVVFQERKDEDAYREAERKINSVLRSEGFVDLCKVKEVRAFKKEELSEQAVDGNGVDFHQHVANSSNEDGQTKELDDERLFELVLTNGLILRLQGFSRNTRDEWIKRLQDLSTYWKARKADDLAILMQTKQQNLDALHIDEEMESVLGQFGKKWEVSKSVASAETWNVCGISSCRTITMAGVLYRKTARRAKFKRFYVVACHGKVLIFDNSLRNLTGAEVKHTMHEKRQDIGLEDAYVYSGILTENDLLPTHQAIDASGRHALPRAYEDGWMSTDDDAMTCFVLWHGMKRSFVRSMSADGQSSHLRRVTALGQNGKAVVFKCRSRQERDVWVMALGMEIERLHTVDEIRVKT